MTLAQKVTPDQHEVVDAFDSTLQHGITMYECGKFDEWWESPARKMLMDVRKNPLCNKILSKYIHRNLKMPDEFMREVYRKITAEGIL